MNQDMLSILQCPTCQEGALRFTTTSPAAVEMHQGELACEACESLYLVEFGFPALIPHNRQGTREWEIWRAHLEKFQARREDRISNPNRQITRWMETSRPKQPFAKFIGIESGTVLDVGCGPGKFRFNFDLNNVKYYGLDPINLAEVREFPFVQGLAEYLPFKAASFADVVVLAALDHFREPSHFFREAKRVLQPGGRLHILQSVHEVRGPVSAVKVLGHKVKDTLEDWHTREYGTHVPKHLSDFTTRSLIDAAEECFDVTAVEHYNARWYSPTKLFMSFVPKANRAASILPGRAAEATSR
jgi:SAM-dependent methyltransferase